MPDFQGSESITQAEHISPNKTGDNIQAKRTANYVWNSSTLEWERMTQPGGSSSGGKATDAYAISNEEVTGTYEYYGFEDASGNWYILRVTSASGIYQYAAGSSAYSTAWTNRASQSYASYSTTF